MTLLFNNIQFNRWNTIIVIVLFVVIVVINSSIDAFTTTTGTGTTIKHKQQQQQQQRNNNVVTFSFTSLLSSTSPMVTDNNNNSDNNDNDNNNKRTTSTTTKKMSIAIPFLSCPTILINNVLPGNNGFDPFQFCQSNDDIVYYRECEIRHSRLAMLACIGWPLSEIYNNQFATLVNMPSLVDSNNRVPNLINGGLFEQVSPVFWGFCFGLTAAIEQVAITTSRTNQNLVVLTNNDNDKGDNTNNNNNGYYIGNLGFDPLNLYPKTNSNNNNNNNNNNKQYTLQLSEIKHGRIAMIAITIFVLQEYITQTSIV